jgi:hypothetical protein
MSVETVGQACFYGCKALATVKFEHGSRLSKCGSFLFIGCVSLSSVSIPASTRDVLSESHSFLKIIEQEAK